MSVWGAIKSAVRRRPKVYGRRVVRARYDAAQTTEDNRRHWAMADGLSSISANSAPVRKLLRERSRYEVANNCYARGILNTVAAYTVGSGPTLQLTYQGPETNPERLKELRAAAQSVERQWAIWATQRRLTQKLTSAVLAWYQDGEAFGVFANSRPGMRTPVQLNVRLYECDQFDDPAATINSLDDSGVRLDQAGEPDAYSMLRAHPGDAEGLQDITADWIPASEVLHVYRRERPGQLRGIPATTPALPLFALLRRFELATVTAAETAADFAAILYSENPPDDDEDNIAIAGWDRIPIERGAFTTVPYASRLEQLKAEHPNSTFDEFVRAILREIARALSVPAVVALGDASNYNYASGRLDLQSFSRQMAADRSQYLERDFLDRIFEAWLDEALLIDAFLPAPFVGSVADWSVGWRWPEPEHVDRAKEASGQQTELANGTTTWAIEYARRGLDWEEQRRQRYRELARDRELAEEYGVRPEGLIPEGQNDPPEQPDETETGAEDDDEAEAEAAAAEATAD